MMLTPYLILSLLAPSSSFVVGEPAPALTLPSSVDGKSMSLADFRGRKVMLHVWASW